jgi:hypothetical protein
MQRRRILILLLGRMLMILQQIGVDPYAIKLVERHLSRRRESLSKEEEY